jgi:hypothetical protein
MHHSPPEERGQAPTWYKKEGVYVLAIAVVFPAFWAFTLPFVPVVSFNKLQPTQFVSV